jgi:hypothetical protein
VVFPDSFLHTVQCGMLQIIYTKQSVNGKWMFVSCSFSLQPKCMSFISYGQCKHIHTHTRRATLCFGKNSQNIDKSICTSGYHSFLISACFSSSLNSHIYTYLTIDLYVVIKFYEYFCFLTVSDITAIRIFLFIRMSA